MTLLVHEFNIYTNYEQNSYLSTPSN